MRKKVKSSTKPQKGKAVPKGYHKMPDGTLMKGPKHK